MVQFITQVATSIEQSQQLIELGVKPETADLVYRCTKSKMIHWNGNYNCVRHHWKT